MNNQQLITALAAATGQPKTQCANLLKALAAILQTELSHGNPVKISKIATFKITYLRPRRGFNPQNQTEIKIPARTHIKIVPSSALRRSAPNWVPEDE